MCTEHRFDDLRERVAEQLHETLHGRVIDTLDYQDITIEHMLGLVSLDSPADTASTNGTMLDPTHEFWDAYYKEVTTSAAAREQIAQAVESLHRDNMLQISYPRGEAAGLEYVTVETVTQPESSDSLDRLTVFCPDCEQYAVDVRDVSGFVDSSEFELALALQCPDCPFSGTYATTLRTNE